MGGGGFRKTIMLFPTHLDQTVNPYLRHRVEDTVVADQHILQMFIGHGESGSQRIAFSVHTGARKNMREYRYGIGTV